MTAPAPSARVVHVLPHTHWDREWYAPYPAFRIRLVELLDELLPRLEDDPSFTHFQLDGQMAVVDDYLEVRPEQRDLLTRLARSGRLSMGPWYVLPDEFLVSGETLVRDLQLGLRRAEPFGGAMRVGYLPDMFGHIAQMPQILSLFDMTDAVVWRGVPSSVQAPAFLWQSPDGSDVRAEYLPGGYFNGSAMSDDVDELATRIDLFARLQDPWIGDRILWMAGMDHEAPPPHLPNTVAGLHRRWSTEGGSVHIGSLVEYLADAPAHDGELPLITGELRSSSRANLLMGVTSNRVDVKVAAAVAERTLERLAEPLDTLWQVDRRWAPLLELAWLEVIRNAAHDSICACSHDEVVAAVLHRYAEAARTAHEVADRAVAAAGVRMSRPGTYLLNPGPTERSEVIELTLPPTEEPVAGMQVLGPGVGPEGLHGAEPHQRVLALTAPVPGFGWALAVPLPPEEPVAGSGEYGLANGLLRVRVEPTDGTWSIDGLAGLGRLVDRGDVGDTYNWCPPDIDTIVDQPESVSVTVTECGPLRGMLEIDVVLRLPEREGTDERGRSIRTGAVAQHLRTTLELRAGERFVRVRIALEQCARDHRLRAHFPLPRRTDHSLAECAYAVVRRPLHAESGPNEWGVPTFPSRRFVRAGGLLIAHEGLCEYELVDLDGDAEQAGTTAGALALTLVRSTGWLSRGPMASRPLPAGPEQPLEGSQVLTSLTLRAAVAVDPDGSIDAHEMCERVFSPLPVVQAPGGGDLPDRGSWLSLRGAAVDAVLPDDRQDAPAGGLVVRVHEAEGRSGELVVEGRSGSVIDLTGATLTPFDGRMALRPHQIVTLRLDPPQER